MWRTHMRQAILYLVLFASCLWAQQAFAAPGSHSFSSPSGQALQLHAPMLGQSRARLNLTQPLGFTSTDAARHANGDDFGVMDQAFFGPGAGALAAVLITGVALWTAGQLTVLGGNIYALASGNGRLGWGISGIVMGGIGTIGSLIHILSFVGLAGVDAGSMGILLGIAALHLANLALGIANVATWRRRPHRRRDYRRDGGPPGGPRDGYRDDDVPGGHIQLTPWATVGKDNDFQGGLAVVGSF